MSNNSDISTGENGLYVGATDNMVHRVHTNLTDTLESHSDVKQKPSEKGSSTAINIPSTLDEKAEVYSDSQGEGEEEKKKPGKIALFYQKHLPWFQ